MTNPLLPLFLVIVGVLAGAHLSVNLMIFLTAIAGGIFFYAWVKIGFRELSGLLTIIVLTNMIAFTVPMWLSYVYYENTGILSGLKTAIFRN